MVDLENLYDQLAAANEASDNGDCCGAAVTIANGEVTEAYPIWDEAVFADHGTRTLIFLPVISFSRSLAAGHPVSCYLFQWPDTDEAPAPFGEELL